MARTVLAAALLAVLAAVPRPARAIACDSNLLVVLDRSCSMQNPPTANETRTKWEIAVQAISALADTYRGKIRFGLALFPDQVAPNCEQADISIPVGAGQEDAVVDLLLQTQPNGPCVTNIDTAMQQAATDPGFADTQRRSFVLLITDGMQSNACGGVAQDPVTVQAIADLYDALVNTYVVGFGGAVRPASLDLFAQAGGVGNPTSPYYFQADDAAQLEAVLALIAGAVSGDPELGGCMGLPCPDGRCPDPAATCSPEGICVAPPPDGGLARDAPGPPGPGDAAAGTDGGAGALPTGNEGCGCRAAGGPGPAAFLVGLLLLGLAARRR